MRRTGALARGLALLAVAAVAGGCGTSTVERKKVRDPAGQGETRGPAPTVQQVEDLRGGEVTIAANRFQPQQVSIGLDSSVRIVNRSKKTVRVLQLKRLNARINDPVLDPGEKIELEFLDGGREILGLKGSRARLEIDVFPNA
jgi:hypothetical protein